MPLDVGGWELAGCLAIVVVGAVVQGSIGFGINLMVAPVMAVLAPGSVPGSMVLLSLPLTITMLLREHHAIDWFGVRWILTGRVPGTLLGLLVVALVSDALLATVVGVVIVAGVVLSLVHPGVGVNRHSALTSGFAAGAMGTAAAVDGPPMALLYQHHEGHTIRATLAVCFVAGAAMSGIALGIAGDLTLEQLALSLVLLPGLLVGLAISHFMGPRLHPKVLRPAVLVFAAAAGTVAIVNGLSSL
ncbi:MAG: sulfite exporter TauE/SafE family protein [Actinobacteria bacterium]|nr:sulfite exporter TauE/SafE family protein [Actinomycetota bacterium]